MQVAIVHDFFMNWRGSERQLKLISEIFPNADIFFLVANNKLVKKHFHYKISKIKTSFLDKLPLKNKLYPYFYPLAPIAAESLDLSPYDLVISSSSHSSKGVITRGDALHVSYMYTPTKHLWDLKDDYFPRGSLLKKLAAPILFYLRNWDFQAAQRVDKIVSISKFISERVKKYYKRESVVIYPGVDFPKLPLQKRKEEYFVHITSFEPNKNTELVIEAFKNNKLNLKLIGPKSRNSRKLLSRLPRNIEFLSWPAEEYKNRLISKAQAVIIPGIEDFGMVAIEAQYLGTPVIAYKYGGNLETSVLGFLFDEKTVESLQEKIDELIKSEFDPEILKKFAMKFSIEKFKSEFKKYIEKSYENRN